MSKTFRFMDGYQNHDDKIQIKSHTSYEAIEVLGYLPSYFLEVVDRGSGSICGRVDLRIGVEEACYYEGHIGYYIKPEFRGHHYARRAVTLVSDLAKHHGMTTLIIACNPTNIASIRTIDKLGGEFLEEVQIPKTHERAILGDSVTNRYRLTLNEV